MDYRPPWDFQDGPPRIEQGIDAELGLSDGLFPNVVPTGPRSTPALEDVSVTGYHDLVSHSYSAGTTEAASFHASSAFGSTGGFPMQQHPINNTWNQPPPPNQFHGLGFSTWTPPNAFVASQATAHEQGHPVLRFSCGLMSPIAAYPGQAASNMANDMAPQQPHSQAVSRLTSGPRAFQVIRRHFQHLRRSTPQDIESCWRCKSDHKKCDDGNPCRRCETVPFPGNSAIPCRRGQVCDATAEIPFLCHMPKRDSGLRGELQPPELLASTRFLEQQSERASQVKHEHGAGCNCSLFCRVVNTKVENIRNFEHLKDLYKTIDVPYDILIAKIVWELEDSPEVAQLTGVGSVENLVVLLEAACLFEARWGHYVLKKRLVYASMCCLLYCIQALRLSVRGLLAADPHAHCAQADKCISPAFHNLTRYALRYTEALTMALFHKDRGKRNNWLPAFYSLCLQQHVRRGFMSLEERLRSLKLSIDGMDVEGLTRPLRSASYLQTAVFLFGKISMQGKGKLAKQIRDSRPNPSEYVPQPLHPSQTGSGGNGSMGWQSWQEEGVPEFLGRIFQIPINDSSIPYHPHNNESAGVGSDSDSDARTIRLQEPATAPPTATTVTTDLVDLGAGVIMSNAWSMPSSGKTPEPSIMGSIWSETSYGASDASIFETRSLAPSGTSYAESLNPSVLSLSTVTYDDDTTEEYFQF